MQINISECTLDVLAFNKIDKKEWNNLLYSNKEANYFCSTDYWEVFDEVYCLQLRYTGGKLLGGIIFSIESMIPFVGSLFRVSRAESSAIIDNKIKNSEDLKKSILTKLLNFLKIKNVIYFTITPKVRSNDAEIYQQLNINTSKCGTYILDLTKEENRIYKDFSKGNKSSIQKALKSKVDVKIFQNKQAISYLSDYLILHSSLMERRKTQFSVLYVKSLKYYKTIFEAYFTNIYLAIAYYNDKPAAAAIVTSFDNSIFYYQGASDYDLTKESSATNLLQFEIIKFAKLNGYKTYDFGGADIHSHEGTPLHGVWSFKKSFGGNGVEFDQANFIVNKFRFKLIWKLRNLQNNAFVKSIIKSVRK